MSREGDVRMMMAHPGWAIFIKELKDEAEWGLNRLKSCEVEKIGEARGYLRGLEKALNIPNILINRKG